ncbi:YtxH domain-containing protein [Herbiconiux sp. CPCC 205716]|uniref:YtxH domain-containing protein n=1 Tax=Herbiconiux gentiana TaxID=2970912 RepID=A0ABT2GII8_9MICO|nr:YtxH domain-containing protein [Herbiconiux gentiana]MCS5715926.1 YtxH domain-containing protein [Herbiconiux gentiana]
MRGKIIFVVGLSTGYVLGTRAGRQRYEQIKAGADKVWNTPAVQSGVQKVQEFAGARVDTAKAELSKKARKTLAGLIGREPLDGPQQSAAARKAGSTAPRTPAPKAPAVTKSPAKPAAAKKSGTKPASTTQPSDDQHQPSDD